MGNAAWHLHWILGQNKDISGKMGEVHIKPEAELTVFYQCQLLSSDELSC